MTLQDLLDLAPYSLSDRALFNNDAVRDAIIRNPECARGRRYCFHSAYGGPVHPVLLAVGLGASREVVDLFYDANTMLSGRSSIEGETDGYGRTAIHYACEFRADEDVVLLLLERDPASAYKRDYMGRTALHCACAYSSPLGIVQILTEHCRLAILMEKDRRGRTPLHIACSHLAGLDVIRLLLEFRPKAVKEKNLKGATPLEIVEKIADSTIAELTSLSLINQLLDAKEDDKLLMIWKEFRSLGWISGAALVLEMHPSFIHNLHENDSMKPDLLSKIGQDGNLQTMSLFVRNMTHIFSGINAQEHNAP